MHKGNKAVGKRVKRGKRRESQNENNEDSRTYIVTGGTLFLQFFYIPLSSFCNNFLWEIEVVTRSIDVKNWNEGNALLLVYDWGVDNIILVNSMNLIVEISIVKSIIDNSSKSVRGLIIATEVFGYCAYSNSRWKHLSLKIDPYTASCKVLCAVHWEASAGGRALQSNQVFWNPLFLYSDSTSTQIYHNWIRITSSNHISNDEKQLYSTRYPYRFPFFK